MIKSRLNVADLLTIREQIRHEKPLIHCITNPISINDCANAILAVGAKPIMAEHPLEVEAITTLAGSLAVNLGNITDARMASIPLAGKKALALQHPIIIDLVGIACSKLRLQFAETFITQCRPSVIKGNMSELKALAGVKNTALGIDVGIQDQITENTLIANAAIVAGLAQKTTSVVVASGVIDLLSDGHHTYAVKNGCEMLSLVTGTGCMLNALIGTFLASQNILGSALLATTLLGVCGETAIQTSGPGTFRSSLIDQLYTLTDETFQHKANYFLI
ncbi:MAG: hydroxyethylthiazole kinase [Sporomusaceae bacterium]|nr:hydroxyethylthiazole kinase [Sporomusaceae bacterium]